jgi:hypothetical protein
VTGRHNSDRVEDGPIGVPRTGGWDVAAQATQGDEDWLHLETEELGAFDAQGLERILALCSGPEFDDLVGFERIRDAWVPVEEASYRIRLSTAAALAPGDQIAVTFSWRGARVGRGGYDRASFEGGAEVVLEFCAPSEGLGLILARIPRSGEFEIEEVGDVQPGESVLRVF